MDTAKNQIAVKELFEAALERRPEDRISFLQAECTDPELRAEVGRLLAECQEAGGFLSSPVVDRLGLDSTASGEPDQHAKPTSLGAASSLGSYQIHSRIGAGGMGEVYRATDTKLGREVALKVLPSDMAQNPDRLARFRHEARTLAQLDHPNIVTIYSVEEANGVHFLTMQLVHGSALDRLISPGGLRVEQIVEIAVALAHALAAAHEKGIIHRDLKPANVMVNQEGQVKVLDFGLAKDVRTPDPAATTVTSFQKTQEGVLVGTPAYMSPEQITGRVLDHRTDIFSLGVMLHQMAAGRRPFVGSSSLELVTSILRDPAKSLVEIRPDFPADLAHIISRCLEKDPARRVQTARDLSNELQEFASRGFVTAPRTSLVSSRQKERNTQQQPHWTHFVAVGVILVVLATLAGYEWRKNLVTREPVLAVIGFKNLSADPQHDWLGTELSESLTTDLGGSKGIRTVATDDVATVKTELSVQPSQSLEREDLSNVRDALGANYLLFGRYAVAGSPPKLDLNIALQDSRGKTLADFHESGPVEEYQKVIADASFHISEKIGIASLSAAQVGELQNVYPVVPEASHLYFQALDKLRSFDAATALSLLKKARDLEPDNISIHWGLAEAWAQLRHDPEAAREAREASSLASKNSLPQEYVVLAQARAAEANKQWDSAIDNYRSLFALFPYNLSYGLDLASVQLGGSKPVDALATLDKLSKLPLPVGKDPRIETLKAKAYEALNDYNSELRAAETALSEASERNARMMQARAELELCWAHRNLGHVDAAYSACSDAQNLFSAFGDNVSAAVALNGLATWLSDRGQYAEAKQIFDRIIQVNQTAGAQRDLAGACVNAARTLDMMGKPDEAADYIQRALAAAGPIGDEYDEAIARILRGEILVKEGKTTAGEKEIQLALAIARRSNDQSIEATALSNLAQIQSETNTDQAIANYRLVLRLRRENGEKAAIATCLMNMGDVLFRRGELKSALESYTEALDIDTTLKNRDAVAGDEISLAQIELERGNLQEARNRAMQAVRGYHEAEDADGELEANSTLIRVLLAQNSVAEAAPYVQRIQPLTSKDPETNFESRLSIVEYLGAIKKTDEAIPLLKTLSSDAQSAGMHFIALQSRLELVKLQAKQNPGPELRPEIRKELVSIRADARQAGFGLLLQQASKVAI